MLRLLCVTAHPDDEAGGFGGSLLHYRERGVETHVICLTPGQAGSHRGGASTPEQLAELRKQEFQRACKILKVSQGEVLDYPDGQLDRVPILDVTGALVRRIRQIRPQVVMCFGPEGAVTAHSDHSMSSLFTTLAFHWAGRSNRFVEQIEKEGLPPHSAQKLYCATTSFMLPDRQPVSLPPATAEIKIGPYLDKKIEAFQAHTSQNPLVPIFSEMLRQRGSTELFHLAASITPRKAEWETDLFHGVEE